MSIFFCFFSEKLSFMPWAGIVPGPSSAKGWLGPADCESLSRFPVFLSVSHKRRAKGTVMRRCPAKKSCAAAAEWQHQDGALLWSCHSPALPALRPHGGRGGLRCQFDEPASHKLICRVRERHCVAGLATDAAAHGYLALRWCFFQNIRPEISDRTVREIVVVSLNRSEATEPVALAL